MKPLEQKIEALITLLSGQTFSDHYGVNDWLRKNLRTFASDLIKEVEEGLPEYVEKSYVETVWDMGYRNGVARVLDKVKTILQKFQ